MRGNAPQSLLCTISRKHAVQPGNRSKPVHAVFRLNVLRLSANHLFVFTDLLLQPNISGSSSVDRVSEAQQQGFHVLRGSTFTISCSVQPQYPGGSFHLTFTSSTSALNYTQPAVNHSAHFLFPAAEPAHQGSYRCVYHVYVFSHDFFSESRLISLTVADLRPFIIRAIVLPLILLLANIGLYFYYKGKRGQRPSRREKAEPDYYNLGVPAAEEEGAQGAE
ncbi:uncharacterized protein LOC141774615 [Sebastes fasciatus]|uniref:uncharacterized protein LOC141774615 n=1 Tax=Sebastes fasciatus TaxID=394691 RepID=UPI003D9E397C